MKGKTGDFRPLTRSAKSRLNVPDSEDEFAVLLPGHERVQDGPVHRDLSCPARLRVLDENIALQKIDVFPFEAEDFPFSHPGIERQGDDRPDPGACRTKKAPCLIGAENAFRRLRLAELPDSPGGILFEFPP